MRQWKWYGIPLGVALVVSLPWAFATIGTFPGAREPEFLPENALYVWQRAWNSALRDSLPTARQHASHLMVLAAEESAPPIAVDWHALTGTGMPVTLVLRYHVTFGQSIAANPSEAAQRIANDLAPLIAAAQHAGTRLVGVQLDYDAPTAGLHNYRLLLEQLAPHCPPDLGLSITTLPTWLQSPNFSALVDAVDYYVLQVHSLERPGAIDTPLLLCDTAKLDGYLAKTEAVGVPFYIAFPTHGYEVAYDASGSFIGLAAEGPRPAWPPDTQIRQVRAEPAALAACIQKLRLDPPKNCRGYVWFRMPVATDTRNWSWATLAAVMEGRAPTAQYRAEVRHPEPRLAEIWLASEGEDTAQTPVTVSLAVSHSAILASDCVNGFSATAQIGNDRVTLQGETPGRAEPIMLAWYRMRDEATAKALAVLSAGVRQ